MAATNQVLNKQDQVREFILQRAVGALPQVEVLACHPQERESFFYLHLRDPFSKADLLLPVSGLWVEECQTGGDCSRLNRAFESAAEILDFKPPSGPKGN